MATTVLSNSHYNLRVTYNISGGQVIFTKIEGMSTNGYESHGYSSALYLNSSAIFSSGTVRFPGNSYYTIWEDSGGWGTSVFAGYFYATNCGGASNLKFWYDFDVPSYTLTLKTSTGVDSFTGGGTYKSGTTATTKATASTGYTLSKYTGTNNSGTTETWTGCAGKTSHTDTWTIERNRTITAYANPNKYTVTYNKNNGTGTMSNSTATYGAGFTTRKNTFTRSGYTFNGWNEKADGSGQAWTLNSIGVYESGKGAWTWKYTKNITLYAQWKANNQYNVTYDANGGATVDGLSIWSNKATYGSSYTVAKNNYSASAGGGQWYIRDGYEFIGWSTSATATTGSSWGSNKQSDVGSSYVTAKNDDGTTIYYWTGTWSGAWAQKDIVLYAVWKPKTYTLSFDANGGTNTLPSSSLSQTVTFNTATSVWRNVRGAGQTNPDGEWITRTGYEFVGWGTNASSTSGTSWASLNLEDLETKDYIENGDSYLTSTNKEGRTVYYWRGLWRWARDYKLYALWRPYGTFSVIKGTGVSSVTGGDAEYGYKYDEEVTFEAKSSSGYLLDYALIDGTEYIQLSGNQYSFSVYSTDKQKTVEVFATKITYDVNYDKGVATSGTAPETQQKIHGTALTLQTNSGNLEHSNTTGTTSQTAALTVSYSANGGSDAPSSHSSTSQSISGTYPIIWTADGWSTSSSGTTKSYSFGASYTSNAGLTLYPYWKKENGNTTWTSKSFSITLSSTKPTWAGYKFVGWYDNSSLTGTMYNPGDTYTKSINTNTTVTFYAKWEISANTYIKVNGEWKLGEIYVKDNGTWKKGKAYTKNTTWKH